MAEPKTRKTRASVRAFLAAIEDDTRRADAKRVLALMQDATGEKPAMWGSSIVGFGSYASATGDWPIVGFSPRKANLVVYIMPGFAKYDALLAKLGRHETGKSCLYLGKLVHVNESVLRDLVVRSVAAMRAKYGA
jgi:hypothetical protein